MQRRSRNALAAVLEAWTTFYEQFHSCQLYAVESPRSPYLGWAKITHRGGYNQYPFEKSSIKSDPEHARPFYVQTKKNKTTSYDPAHSPNRTRDLVITSDTLYH